MDMSYSTILVFGEQRSLYRENILAYMVRNGDNPNNDLIYVVDTNLGSSIFYNYIHFEKRKENNIKFCEEENEKPHT